MHTQLGKMGAKEKCATMLGHLVLVVDDDELIRELIATVLEYDLNLKVLAAVDGLDALQKLDGAAPALVVTDVVMPNLDGVGLIRRLRSSPTTQRVPILVVAASPSKRDEAMAAGGTAYVDKPFDCDLLVEKARSFLSA